MKIITSATQGSAFITVFTLMEQLDADITPLHRVWDMGDGTVYEDIETVEHTYNFAGIFSVVYKIIDVYGAMYTDTAVIKVNFLIHDAAIFTRIPETYSDPGQVSDIFTVALTSTQIDKPLNVDLFALNSKSIPTQFIDSRWNMLVPRWRFVSPELDQLKGDYPTIFEASAVSVPLTALNTKNEVVVCALSGEVQFRYIDDTSTGIPYESQPLILTVTLQSSAFTTPKDSLIYNYKSYANSDVTTATIAWQVNYLPPAYLNVTSNYHEGIFSLKWVNVPIPFLITSHVLQTAQTKTKTGVSFNYPGVSATASTDVILLTSDDNVTFLSADPLTYTIDPAPPVFRSIDEQDVDISGYVFGSLTTTITSNFAKISVNTSAVSQDILQAEAADEFIFPFNNTPIPVVWICNPIENTVTRMRLTPVRDLSSTYMSHMIVGTIKAYNTLNVKVYDGFNYQLTGESGTYCVAVDPANTSSPYSAVVVDTMSDSIYRLAVVRLADGTDTYTTLCSSLTSYINYTSNKQQLTPASVSIDSNSDIWLSQYNCPEIIKLDKDFKLITRIVLNPNSTKIIDGDINTRVTVVETDQYDNLWVGYTTESGSVLAKFTTTGKLVKFINLPVSYTIAGITMAYDGSTWITTYTGIGDHGSSSLIHISSSCEVLQTYTTTYKYITHLCVDRQSNLWFSHNIRSIGTFNIKTHTLHSWDIDIYGNTTTTPIHVAKTSSINSEIGGLTVDTFNRLWVIDSVTNKVYCINSYKDLLATDSPTKVVISIHPNTKIHHHITPSNSVKSAYLTNGKSVRSIGDFTGNRWLQKYSTSNKVLQLSGDSNTFAVKHISNNEYNLRRVNESFNMTEYMASLAIPEYMKDYTELYNTLFNSVVGDDTYVNNNVGLGVYEKIANFNINTSDIDTCNIQQLISLAKMTGNSRVVEVGTGLPVGIRRVLDIASVAQSRLCGTLDMSIRVDNPNIIELTDAELPTPPTALIVVSGDSLLSPTAESENKIDQYTTYINLDSYMYNKIPTNSLVLSGDLTLGLVNKSTSQVSTYTQHLTLSCHIYDLLDVNTRVPLISTYNIYHLTQDSINSDLIHYVDLDDYIIPGTLIRCVVKETNVPSVRNIPAIDGDVTTTHRLSSIYDFELGRTLTDTYLVYSMCQSNKDFNTSVVRNNLIDWRSSFNTIKQTRISSDEWCKDDGLVDTLFNNALTQYLTITSGIVE